MHRPLIIGITGGIGGGKSTLAELLRAEGYSVYDSDLEARRLQNEHSVMRKKMVDLFGENIYSSSGLNRSALAKIVFRRPELLLKLNNIVHPLVREDFSTWISHRMPKKILFVESAILFESGMDKLVDLIILVTASEEVRVQRVVRRDGVTPEHVRERIAYQQHDEEKIDKVDYVIRTDDNQPLVTKMRKIIEELKLRRTDERFANEV